MQLGSGNAIMGNALRVTTNVIEKMIVPTTVMKVMLLVVSQTFRKQFSVCLKLKYKVKRHQIDD